ncbi:GNAT family N-acetyltransferase [Microbulbifer halophilus]|uniref:GNAT family N-acetyltransferase n=1 Tax=Microbulbifer halophilus TaxID=453963 RepID=A0ABW5EFG9_9GAMM|nr:GNAT family N-acetyltransferase [Microbulbifer halophilus]MCW8126952.1 GNAT family N-acetyltransferase [Microbulbifer halophilus]
MQAQLFTPEQDLDAIATVLLQLRPQYHLASIKARIHKQRQNGYQLAYVSDNNGILCVAGFVVGEKLAWGRHLYIDDLVTDESHRSTGAGRFLIDWLKDYAREIGCKQIHLDSGVQRFSADRFYLREGFDIASHHFSTSRL